MHLQFRLDFIFCSHHPILRSYLSLSPPLLVSLFSTTLFTKHTPLISGILKINTAPNEQCPTTQDRLQPPAGKHKMITTTSINTLTILIRISSSVAMPTPRSQILTKHLVLLTRLLFPTLMLHNPPQQVPFFPSHTRSNTHNI